MKVVASLIWFGLIGFALADPGSSVDIPADGVAQVVAEEIDVARFRPQVDHTVDPRYRGFKKERMPAPRPYPGREVQPFGSVQSLTHSVPPVRELRTIEGIGYSLSVPPDPEIAVGPRHIVSTVNTRIAFYDKYTGAQTFEQRLGVNGFFNLPNDSPSYLSDPKLAYDHGSGRFYVSVLDVRDSKKQAFIHLAVSKTSNPNDGWWKYSIRSDTTINGITYWVDYPMLGFSRSGILVAGNMFSFGAGTAYGTRAIAIRKSSVLSGGTALVTYFNEANSYGWQPMRSIDTNVDRLYAVNVRYTTALQVYCFQNLGGSPSMVKLTEPPSPESKVLFVPEMIAPRAASSPGNRFIDSLDSRLSFCWYVDGKLLVAHSTRVSAADLRSQLRWYEINLNQWPVGSTTPSIGQRGSLTGGAGMAYYVPALATNRDGDMAMLFTRSSPSIVADLMTAYRRPSDPANSFGSPSVVFSSEGGWYGSKFNASDPARWGDYFGLSIDPVDRTSFWACGMIGAATQAEPYRWKTRIFRFNTRPTVTKTYAVRLINRIFGGTPTGNLRSAQTADNQYFSIPAGGTPTRAVARYTIRIPGDRTRIQRLNYVIEYAGINGGQIIVRMLNRRTGLYEQIGTAPMNATDLRRGFSIERHFADYYDALGDVVFEVTATGPSPFLYKTDFTALQVISV